MVIHDKVQRGAAIINASGSYIKEQKDVILCLVSTNELKKIQEEIYTGDKDVFMFVTEATNAYGEGFNKFVLKNSKQKK